MTSSNNIQTIVEPAFTAVWMGLAGSLIFSFCQYFNERRRRREFRNSWTSNPPKDHGGPTSTASPPAPSLWNWVAVWWQTRATRQEAEPFPSFPSYFIHHIGRYGFAILSVTLVLIVRWLLEPVLEGSMPFSFFLAAVLLTARTQGIWETLLALVLGFLLGTWFFAQPNTLGFSDQHDWWAAALYFVVGLGIVWFLKSEQTAWLRTLSSDLSALKGARQLRPERAAHERSPGTRDLLASIVEYAQDPILSITREGRITTWNAAAEKFLGWSAQEAIGQPLTTFLPPPGQAELRQITEQVARGERLKNWQTILSAKNGDRIEALMTISPVKEPSGQLVGVSLIAQHQSRGLE
jgi:PAS domain S-box-containing protein